MADVNQDITPTSYNGEPIHHGRLVYVDPNHFRQYDGVDLGPDYTDMCISFNLIVETSKRLASNRVSGTIEDNFKRVISISGSYGTIDNRKNASALEGAELDTRPVPEGQRKNQYLTTYYTDITYGQYGKKEMIEGLGVTSIDIAFESYVAPTVTMKFVDVRGSSIWGREEAVHQQNHLSADSIYGCFFTYPYPRFKLQVKGYYGEPVTMQLICSSFKGNFNSETGDFEATATFIGYRYAWLADIPFGYLIAAPYCKYIGKPYFEQHQNDESWRLRKLDGTTTNMITLKDYIAEISQHMTTASSSTPSSVSEEPSTPVLSEAESRTAGNSAPRRAALQSIQTHVNTFISDMQGLMRGESSNVSYVEYDNTGILVWDDNSYLNNPYGKFLPSQMMQQVNEIIEEINRYNSTYSDTPLPSNASNNFFVELQTNGYIATRDIGVKTNGSFSMLNNFLSQTTAQQLQQPGYLKEGVTLPNNIATELAGMLERQNNTAPNFSTPFVLNDGNFQSFSATTHVKASYMNTAPLRNEIASQMASIENVVEDINRRADERSSGSGAGDSSSGLTSPDNSTSLTHQIYDILSVTPYLGNIVKMILAHFETFVRMLSVCAQTVRDQHRTVDTLGIQLNQTDLVNYGDDNPEVPPFPAVYSQGSDEQGVINPDKNTWEWVGNLGHKFKEEELVNGILEALTHAVGNDPGSTKMTVPSFSPVLPFDLLSSSDPYLLPATNPKVADVMSYGLLRAFQTLGVFITADVSSNTTYQTLVKTLARIDAYNIAFSNPNIKKEIFDVLNGMDLCDTALAIGQCDESVDSLGIQTSATNAQPHFEFEILPNELSDPEGRHPICRIRDSWAAYVHTIRRVVSDDTKRISFIPSKISRWENYLSTSTGSVPTAMTQARDYGHPMDQENYYYHGTYRKAKDFLVTCSDANLLQEAQDENGSVIPHNKYLNDGLFDVIIDPEMVGIAEQLHDRYKGTATSGTVTFALPSGDVTEDNMLAALEPVWKMDNTKYKKYYGGVTCLYTKTFSPNNDGTQEKLDEYYSPLDANGNIRSDRNVFTDYRWKDKQMNFSVFMGDDGLTSGGSPIDPNETFIIQSQVLGDGVDVANLFGHPFYYSQNGVGNSDYCDHAKALLFLHSFPQQFKQIPAFLNKNKNTGSVEKVPYVYLLLLGGFLWRYRFVEKYPERHDIFYYYEGTRPHTDERKVVFKTLYKTYSNGTYKLTINKTNTANSNDFIWISKLFTGQNREVNQLSDFAPDWHIQNRLVMLFEDFVKGEFQSIMRACEFIKPNGGKYTETEFRTLIQDYQRQLVVNTDIDITTANTNMSQFIDTHFKLAGGNGKFLDAYSAIQPLPVNSTTPVKLSLMNKPGSEGETLIRNLWLRKAVVKDGLGRSYAPATTSDTSKSLTYVRLADMRLYLTEYLNTLKDVAVTDSVRVADVPAFDSTSSVPNESARIGIYIYLKNFYDKWLVGYNEEFFTVKHLYDRFIIIDEYYRNIKNLLLINCEKFVDNYNSCIINGSMLTMLDHTGKNATCLFMSVPNFIAIHASEPESHDKMMDVMGKIFKPCPYNSQPSENQEDYFIYLYNNNKSQHCTDQNDFGYDSFDLFSYNEDGRPTISKIIPSVLMVDNGPSDSIEMGDFTIPSFGVAYAKQTQSHFKNMRLSMENPIVTSHSAAIIERIATQGNKMAGEVCFMGQDIYNVHSSYAYMVEIEAMGNMQIQPLMYFQLLNVPMFRGTYIISKVTHSMTPGNMSTKFVGTKVSKWMLPYNRDYWIRVQQSGAIFPDENLFDNCGRIDSDIIHPGNYQRSSKIALKPGVNNPGNFGPSSFQAVPGNSFSGTNVDPRVPWLFQCLVDEIKMFDENKTTETWSIGVTSVGRTSNTKSDHYATASKPGYAMDIKAIKKNGNSWVQCSDEENFQFLWKVFDLLLCVHKSEVRQVIFEYKKPDGNFSRMNCLHVAVKRNDSDNTCQFFVAHSDGTTTTTYKPSSESVGNMPPAYRNTALRMYNNNQRAGFTQCFISYQRVDNNALAQHFAGGQATVPTISSNCNGSSGANGGYAGNYDADNIFGLKLLCERNSCANNKDAIVAALNKAGQDTNLNVNIIMMLFFKESSLTATAGNAKYKGLWGAGFTGAAGAQIKTYRDRCTASDQAIIDKYCTSADVFLRKFPTREALIDQIHLFRILYTYEFKDFGINGSNIGHPGVLEAFNLAPGRMKKYGTQGNGLVLYNREQNPREYSSNPIDEDHDGNITVQDVITHFNNRVSSQITKTYFTDNDIKIWNSICG